MSHLNRLNAVRVKLTLLSLLALTLTWTLPCMGGIYPIVSNLKVEPHWRINNMYVITADVTWINRPELDNLILTSSISAPYLVLALYERRPDGFEFTSGITEGGGDGIPVYGQSYKTAFTALKDKYNSTSSLETSTYIDNGQKISDRRICVGAYIVRAIVGFQSTFIPALNPVCVNAPPPSVNCTVDHAIEIAHGTTHPGTSLTKSTDISLSCTDKGVIRLSLEKNNVDLGSGITSALSLPQTSGGLLSVIRGTNHTSLSSHLTVPAGALTGDHQGSTTLKLEYP